MTITEIQEKFLKFFEKKGHTIVPGAALVPEDDESVLFTSAGMQQFKKYFLGEKDPIKDFNSRNVASVQKCIRTTDIDEVGDATHLTLFEMLGNFSFGGYGRKKAIEYAHEFITKELRLPISYVSFYEGNENVPRDSESEKIWRSLGIKDVREDGADVFWGPTGNSGPCGPTTEIYCKDANGKDVEIWNIVFNDYFCNGSREDLDSGKAKLAPLSRNGIDTGMGLERLTVIEQKKKSVYGDDNLSRNERIIIDHTRAAKALLEEGVKPSNIGRGYIVRRLIRRVIVLSDKIGVKVDTAFSEEETQFRKTLAGGLKEFEKLSTKNISGLDAFLLFSSFGLPIDLVVNLTKEKGISVDVAGFERELEKHKEISRAGVEKKFKGGLEDTSDMSVKYHTTTHLLHQALRDVLGNEVQQKGSNITPERLRFDFAFPKKLTEEEKKRVEEIVNEKIKEDLPVNKITLPLEEAKKNGALHFFAKKYSNEVLIYYIGDSIENAYSKEFCGGPHVERTGVLGTFKIVKEEAVSAGVRRMKGILE